VSIPAKVDPKQAARFLRRGYELEREGWHLLSAFEIGEELGLAPGGSRKVCGYLTEKGFVEGLGEACAFCRELEGLAGPPTSSCAFRLSRRGIDEIEWGFSRSSFLYELLSDVSDDEETKLS
jgi:hypothetical protein